MGENNYILDYITYYRKGSKTIHNPHISGENVRGKKDFFYPENNYVNTIYEKKWKFDYLIPYDYEGIEIKHICDFHSWLREEPNNFFSYVISEKFYQVLNKFNLYPNKFYDAKVLFEEKFYSYYVWQLFMNGFDEFIDFTETNFCEYDEGEKKGGEIVHVSNLKEIRKARKIKDWEDWGFEKLVMKSKFKDMDCVYISSLGIVISERLKNALEEAQPALTGLEILPCPVEFEYL